MVGRVKLVQLVALVQRVGVEGILSLMVLLLFHQRDMTQRLITLVHSPVVWWESIRMDILRCIPITALVTVVLVVRVVVLVVPALVVVMPRVVMVGPQLLTQAVPGTLGERGVMVWLVVTWWGTVLANPAGTMVVGLVERRMEVQVVRQQVEVPAVLVVLVVTQEVFTSKRPGLLLL
jgi:hypothetical protein